MRIAIIATLTISTYFFSVFKCYAQKSQAFEKTLYALLSLDHSHSDSLLSNNALDEQAYLKHYQLFINVMVNDSLNIDYEKIFKNSYETLKSYDDKLNSNYAFLSEIYLQKGIIDFKKDKSSSAIFSFYRAYKLWKKSEDEYPDYYANLKLKGIFNLLMSNMPQPYKKWAGWIGFSGNHDLGFSYLKQYVANTTSGEGSIQEAILYLGFSYLKFSKNDNEIRDFVHHHIKNKNLPITQFVLARCAFKIRKPQLAIDNISCFKENTFLPFCYLTGKWAVFNADTLAHKYLYKYVQEKKSGQFVADTYRYLGWHYLLQGDSAQYFKQQNIIKQLNNYSTSEDKQATYESSLQIPNVHLLRARLLFDAGQYKSALECLMEIKNEELVLTAHKIEFQYRIGRCYHLLLQFDKAVFHYSEAIKIGDNDTRYYAPYAALYAAQIEYTNNVSQAIFLLEEAERLNNGEYKSTIEQKIERLHKKLNSVN